MYPLARDAKWSADSREPAAVARSCRRVLMNMVLERVGGAAFRGCAPRDRQTRIARSRGAHASLGAHYSSRPTRAGTTIENRTTINLGRPAALALVGQQTAHDRERYKQLTARAARAPTARLMNCVSCLAARLKPASGRLANDGDHYKRRQKVGAGGRGRHHLSDSIYTLSSS